jgi:CO/xanthine dehydrogenase Mo-binding subunit
VLEANEQDLEIEDGVVRVKGSPAVQIPLRQLAILANPLRYAFSEDALAATQFVAGGALAAPPPSEVSPGLEATEYSSPSHATFASGAHAAVVEVDPATSMMRIVRYAVVHDCGRMINPAIVEGQIHGGVAQGIGGAFYERMHYDDEGQLLNGSFMDFLMPYVTEIPRMEIGHVETLSPLNPLGIKGVGEAGCIAAAPAIVGALEDALGIEILEAPLSPQRLFELCEAAVAPV